MNTLPPTRKGAEKTWVNAGLSASWIELTRGGAQGGLVAFNFRDRQTLMPGRNRWRLERQREIPAHTFGDVSNLLLDAKPEKPRPLLGDNKGM